MAFKLSIFATSIKKEHELSFTRSLCRILDYFPYKNSFIDSYNTMGLITSLIGEGLKNIDPNIRVNECISIFELVPKIELVVELWFLLKPKRNAFEDYKDYTDEEYETITKYIFNLTKNKFDFEEVLEKLDTRYSASILKIWAKYDTKIKQQSKNYINKSDENPIKLIQTLSNWATSTDNSEPYINDFTTYNMENLIAIVSRDTLEKRITSIFGKQEFHNTANGYNPITNEQLVGIFQQYCRNYRMNQKRKREEKKNQSKPS